MLDRLEALLIETARQKTMLTYRQVAQALSLTPPQVFQKAAALLEALMRNHAQAGAAQLASLVVSRARIDLPAPGYFMLMGELGLYQGSTDGEDAQRFHKAEVQRCYEEFTG